MATKKENTAAVIIAPPAEKLDSTKEINELTPIHWLTMMFNLAGVDRVIVTGGEHLRPMVRYFGRIGAEFIFQNHSIDRGNGLITAIQYLEDKCEKVLVIPAEFTFIEPSTVKSLLSSDSQLACPIFNGECGWPVKISHEYFDAVMRHSGELTGFLRENGVTDIECDDAGVTKDMSRRKNPAPLAKTLSYSTELRPLIKVTIARSRPFFGSGTKQIFNLMTENHSLKRSGALLGMANSYARRIVGNAERNLGIKVYKYVRKGPDAGSYLTDDMKEFLKNYEAFEADCKQYAEESFKRHFGNTQQR